MFITRKFRQLPLYLMRDLKLSRIINVSLRNVDPQLSAPELELMGGVAISDFKNYLKVEWGLLGEDNSDEDLEFLLERYMEEGRIDEKVSSWIVPWVSKWRERVKLVWDEKEFKRKSINEQLEEVTPLISAIPKVNELKELIIGSLIKSGELCFTNLIADNIIKGEVYRLVKSVGSREGALKFLHENPLFLLQACIARVKVLARSKGPAVVLHVDRRILAEALRRIGE